MTANHQGTGQRITSTTLSQELRRSWPTMTAWLAVAIIVNAALFLLVGNRTDRYLSEGGYLLGLIGLDLSIAGFAITFWQLSRTASAAQTAARAVDDLRDRLMRYDAAKEIAQASYAISIARSHVSAGLWSEISRRCEDANQALMRIDLELIVSPTIANGELSRIIRALTKLIDRIDAALSGKGTYPDETKLTPTLRRHSQTLSQVLLELQKEVGK